MSLSYTVDPVADASFLGQDVAVRFIGATTSAINNNRQLNNNIVSGKELSLAGQINLSNNDTARTLTIRSGAIGGSVTVAASANLTPGSPVGTLDIGGSLDIAASAGGAGTLSFDLASIAASDQVAVTGTLEIGSGVLGSSDFDLTDLGGLQNGTYTGRFQGPLHASQGLRHFRQRGLRLAVQLGPHRLGIQRRRSSPELGWGSDRHRRPPQ